MAKIRFTDASEVPFVAGRLCLDFVNTTGYRNSDAPRERLGSYGDFISWSRRAELLGEDTSERRDATATREARALAAIRSARECLYRVFYARLSRSRPSREDIALVRRLHTKASQQRSLTFEGQACRFTWSTSSDLQAPLWPIIYDGAELLTSEVAERIRECGECDWLFLDLSKNGSRRWCKKTCGDRVKARRYYARTTADK